MPIVVSESVAVADDASVPYCRSETFFSAPRTWTVLDINVGTKIGSLVPAS